MSATEAVQATPTPAPAARPRRSIRALLGGYGLFTAIALLFGVPWLTLVLEPGWPGPVTAAASAVLLAGAVALPVLMVAGHGRRHRDKAAVTGATLLGVIWVLFTWSVFGNVARLVTLLAGHDSPRAVAFGVLAVATVLCLWGWYEAMRVPRVRRVEVVLDRLGAGLDGVTVALLTDTHYGPINRARWSARTIAATNALNPDIACHTGDIADGAVTQRREQAAPLGAVRAPLARVYVTGNHEYFSQAQGWVDHMGELGWEALRNRHVVVERGGDRLVVAGVDDATASGSGLDGHGEDLGAALDGADSGLPVLLLAHQPKQIPHAVAHGVDLQISGHTHGGQIWPFGLLVRLDQPVVAGLSRHGDRTQLYTSRGSGFWGPPLRIFAPSEITLITLRAGGAR